MKPIPAGELVPTADGYDLVLTRTLRAPVEDVWASLTQPARTARWFGPWEGAGETGGTVKVQMVHEEGQPWLDMRVDACEPPSRLAVSTTDDEGTWRMEVRLSHTAGKTELRLIQHIDRPDTVSSSGPGWEYYLDMLVAARDNAPLPNFADYYPAQAPYYATLTPTP